MSDDMQDVIIYNNALFLVNYYEELDTWECIDACFIVKGIDKTRNGAISEAHNQWDKYIKTQL